MAVVAVLRSTINPSSPPPTGPRLRHPKMEIVPEGGAPFIVPFAPRGSDLDGVAADWQSVARGGRKPLLLRGGGSLQVMRFDLVLGHPDPDQSVEPQLAAVRRLAASGARFRVKLDATSGAFRWRMTAFSQEVVSRQHGTNQPTRAVVQMTFTEAADMVVQVGPVSGGSKGGGKDKPEKRPKFYVVKKGDTLQSIAKRFYGDPSVWRRIADANKIKKPKELKVGRRLELPRIAISSISDVRTVNL